MCVVNVDPTESAVITPCTGAAAITSTDCYCKALGIAANGDFCDTTKDKLFKKCKIGETECPGTNETVCTIVAPGCACAGVVAMEN